MALYRPYYFRYLGLYMDNKLTWDPHTRLKGTKTNRLYRMLIANTWHPRETRLTLNNKILNGFTTPLSNHFELTA
jgi:hypothetical protein